MHIDLHTCRSGGGVVELFFYFGKQFGGRTGRSEGRGGVCSWDGAGERQRRPVVDRGAGRAEAGAGWLFDRGNGRKAGVGGGRASRLRGFDLKKQSLRSGDIRCAARVMRG